MKTLLLSTALAVIGFATAARAGSITIGDLTISQLTPAQILAQKMNAFNDVPVGMTDAFVTSVCSPGCVETIFTGGTVANGTTPASVGAVQRHEQLLLGRTSAGRDWNIRKTRNRLRYLLGLDRRLD